MPRKKIWPQKAVIPIPCAMHFFPEILCFQKFNMKNRPLWEDKQDVIHGIKMV